MRENALCRLPANANGVSSVPMHMFGKHTSAKHRGGVSVLQLREQAGVHAPKLAPGRGRICGPRDGMGVYHPQPETARSAEFALKLLQKKRISIV